MKDALAEATGLQQELSFREKWRVYLLKMLTE
jgi:hypothetical protein